MPPKKIIDKGKGISLEPISEKPEPTNTSPKTEPWISVTKKSAKKEEIPTTPKSLQSPEAIMNQMLQLQKAFELSFSKQESGESSKNLPSQAISKNNEVPSKMISRENQTSKIVSKPSNNSQIILKQISQTTPSEYFEKHTYQNIINIEKGFFVNNDPFLTIEKYFGKNNFFKPHNTDKTVLFFQTILEITDSVSFKHFYLNENHTDAAYSTFKIHKIIAPCDWEYDLNDNLNFPEDLKNLPCYNVPFNYWDYCQAWYNSFLIQSPKHKHTWLIFFDTTCNLSKSPYWFIPWWNYFGSVTEIFKPNIQKSFQIFKTNFIPSEEEKKFPPLALFHSKFHFPWVFSWTLEFTSDPIPVIQRKFRVKWWDKYKIPSNLYPSNILTWIKEQNSKIQTLNQTQNQTPETTFFLAQKSKMLAMLAGAKSEEEIKAISLQFLPSMSDQISRTSGSDSGSQVPDIDEEIFGNSGV